MNLPSEKSIKAVTDAISNTASWVDVLNMANSLDWKDRTIESLQREVSRLTLLLAQMAGEGIGT